MHRDERERYAVMFLDLDRFKHVNDTHGHPTGDAVLTTVSRRLVNAVREGDHVGRLGGDEFVVVAEPIDGVMVSNWYQQARQIKNTEIDGVIGRPKPGVHGWSGDPKSTSATLSIRFDRSIIRCARRSAFGPRSTRSSSTP